jgi:hypothetical protein
MTGPRASTPTSRARARENLNGMLKTLRVSNINDNDYYHDNDQAFDSSAGVSGEAGEV